ncbi:hypothetical protein EVAR_27440_1 [Eumeta japonica]|uniref:Uncharacterized protein n=1 Tax=Eumeta variegata TaxID=151549 RepID=A0A4C1VKL5_EUMVA|nr:hypothetical protein EVAR_27440_1 [Eumeta japonica]
MIAAAHGTRMQMSHQYVAGLVSIHRISDGGESMEREWGDEEKIGTSELSFSGRNTTAEASSAYSRPCSVGVWYPERYYNANLDDAVPIVSMKSPVKFTLDRNKLITHIRYDLSEYLMRFQPHGRRTERADGRPRGAFYSSRFRRALLLSADGALTIPGELPETMTGQRLWRCDRFMRYKHSARYSAALNYLRMLQCAGSPPPDSSSLCPTFLFYAFVTNFTAAEFRAYVLTPCATATQKIVTCLSV